MPRFPTFRFRRFAVAATLAALAAVGLVHEARLLHAQPTSRTAPSRPPGAAVRFRHLGVEDGLPNRWVSAIWQDSLGFVWIGTEDGLARYDGSTLKTYRQVPFDTTSLGSTWIVDLGQAPDGDMWVLSADGPLGRYSPRRDAFSSAPGDSLAENGYALLTRRDGSAWISGEDGGLYRRTEARTATERVASATELGGDVTALAESADGRLYVASYGGTVTRFDTDGTTKRLLPDSTSGAQLSDPFPRALLVGRDGRLYIGTGGGLVVSTGDGRFETVAGLGDDTVRTLLEDPAGDVWVGTSSGLVRLDPTTGRTDRYTHDPADPSSLSRGMVEALFLDRTGTLWVGTEHGISLFSWAAPAFEHITTGPDGLSDADVWSVLVGRDGTTWVGTADGLDGFAPDGSVRRIRPSATGIGTGRVAALHEEASGTILVATRLSGDGSGVLARLDPRTGRVVRRFIHHPDLSPGHTEAHAPDELPTFNPSGLQTDRQGRLWVLSSGAGCLSTFDGQTDTFEPHCLAGDPDGLLDAGGFAEDDEGGLWLATLDGLLRLDPETDTVRRFPHDPDDPDSQAASGALTVRAGRAGVLWVGTYGAGLSRFETETGRFRHFHSGNSTIPSNVVHAIEPDDDGRLWLSTNNGLSRFDPDTETFETFGMDDGLQGLAFNDGASARGPDGRLYVGGAGGLNRFDPARIRPPAEPLAVVVTAIEVGGVRARPGAQLAVDAPYADAVRLGPRSRDVSFTVAALGGRASDLRVRLDGYDDAWHAPGPGRTAAYTNLDPGRYTFRVRAGATERALAVAVTPRAFQTWWFRGLALLSVAAAVGALVAVRARRRRDREAHLEATVRERTEALEAEKQTTEAQAGRLREADRLRTRFFTNVSHEFRTPLTLTIGPLEDLDANAEALPEEARWSVGVALRNSRRLLRLTNQLLDAARLESGEMTLHGRRTDIGALVRTSALAFAGLAERQHIHFTTEAPSLFATVDADKIEAILVNLLSNAFKFTPEGGRIGVEVVGEGAGAEIRVRDSGPGIAPADLPHVFDRFYQVDETAAEHSGSGIGLSLARDLAALHGGTIAVESVVGFGSLFTVRLPTREALDEALGGVPPAALSASVGDGARAIPEAPEIADDEPDEPDEPDSRTTILVADDNADIRAYVRSRFGDAYRLLDAADGAEALRIARAETPDLIVSDVMMPEMDGVALVRALRADPETDFIPVVLLTAKADEASVQAGLAAGADDYVVKPFNARLLQTRVDNLIASRHRLRARFGGDGASADTTVDVVPNDDAFTVRVRAVVSERLAEEALTVEDIAEALGVSRSTLHRRLKEGGGETPTAFLRHARLDRAAGLLGESAGTISEVAYAVGFKSVSHFSQAFRSRFGESPSAYIGRTAA